MSILSTSFAKLKRAREQDSALYLIAFVAPLVLQPIVNIITIRSWWDFHNGTLGC